MAEGGGPGTALAVTVAVSVAVTVAGAAVALDGADDVATDVSCVADDALTATFFVLPLHEVSPMTSNKASTRASQTGRGLGCHVTTPCPMLLWPPELVTKFPYRR